MTLALACVLAGKLAVADAGPGKKQPEPAKIQKCVYPVADLVVPIEDHDGTPKPPPRTIEGALMELIRATIAPASWQDKGGRGTVQYHPLGMSLVIEQTPAVHAEILDLLNALRRLQELEVCMEARLVEMSPALAEEFRAHGGFERPAYDKKGPASACLTDKELYPWLRLFQSDPATSILMHPKMTMFNGQQAVVQVMQQESYVARYTVGRDGSRSRVEAHHETIALGNKCVVRPTVSADRRSVQLTLDFKHISRTAPNAVTPVVLKTQTIDGSDYAFQGMVEKPQVQTLAVKHACSVPAGQTLVIPVGPLTTEVRGDEQPAILSKLPVVRHAFANAGARPEQRELFLLLTPRIIVTEVPEQVFQEALPPVPRP